MPRGSSRAAGWGIGGDRDRGGRRARLASHPALRGRRSCVRSRRSVRVGSCSSERVHSPLTSDPLSWERHLRPVGVDAVHDAALSSSTWVGGSVGVWTGPAGHVYRGALCTAHERPERRVVAPRRKVFLAAGPTVSVDPKTTVLSWMARDPGGHHRGVALASLGAGTGELWGLGLLRQMALLGSAVLSAAATMALARAFASHDREHTTVQSSDVTVTSPGEEPAAERVIAGTRG